jgi:hypothetical protein
MMMSEASWGDVKSGTGVHIAFQRKSWVHQELNNLGSKLSILNFVCEFGEFWV